MVQYKLTNCNYCTKVPTSFSNYLNKIQHSNYVYFNNYLKLRKLLKLRIGIKVFNNLCQLRM